MTLRGKLVTLPIGVVGVVCEPASDVSHYVLLDTGKIQEILDRVLHALPLTYRRASL